MFPYSPKGYKHSNEGKQVASCCLMTSNRTRSQSTQLQTLCREGRRGTLVRRRRQTREFLLAPAQLMQGSVDHVFHHMEDPSSCSDRWKAVSLLHKLTCAFAAAVGE